MLSDDASINKINPFIVNEFNLPGTKSEPFAFRDYENPHKENGSPPCAVESSCDTSKSPVCNMAISAGDNTIAMCRPTKPNCPMSRMLLPKRNIDQGRWSLPSLNTNIPIPRTVRRNPHLWVLIAILLILLIYTKN